MIHQHQPTDSFTVFSRLGSTRASPRRCLFPAVSFSSPEVGRLCKRIRVVSGKRSNPANRSHGQIDRTDEEAIGGIVDCVKDADRSIILETSPDSRSINQLPYTVQVFFSRFNCSRMLSVFHRSSSRPAQVSFTDFTALKCSRREYRSQGCRRTDLSCFQAEVERKFFSSVIDRLSFSLLTVPSDSPDIGKS